jgi:hypothetical protein
MRIRGRIGCGLGMMVLLLAPTGVAWAFHDEPPRGRAFVGGVVTAYEPCTSPNTKTQGISPVSACSPPRRSDPVCGFGTLPGSPGKGKLKADVRRGEIELKTSLSGLTFGCEGERLCGVVTVRVTTHRCNTQPCTTVNVELVNEDPSACCTVSGGRCHFKAANPSEDWDALQDGDRAGVELLGCGLRRVTGPNQPSAGRLTFACGLLSP